jgi:hypothetical protein
MDKMFKQEVAMQHSLSLNACKYKYNKEEEPQR